MKNFKNRIIHNINDILSQDNVLGGKVSNQKNVKRVEKNSKRVSNSFENNKNGVHIDIEDNIDGDSNEEEKHVSHSDFKIIKEIGTGTFGKAILCRSKHNNKQYILKKINIHDMNEKERKGAINEVHILKILKHPYIIGYINCFEEKGVLNIIMEYAENGDLCQFIKKQKKPMDERLVLRWFCQICLGLKDIHDKNILHRDLKTQNIFLSNIEKRKKKLMKSKIKLGDFGISKVLNSDTDMAKTVIGTPYYFSPEICEDKPYNMKSDVWSLGCVLYEMLTRRHAFDGKNLPALIMKILRGKYPPIPSFYSKNLRDLLSCMLKKDPLLRPTIQEILSKKFLQRVVKKLIFEEMEDFPEMKGCMPYNYVRKKNKKRRSISSENSARKSISSPKSLDSPRKKFVRGKRNLKEKKKKRASKKFGEEKEKKKEIIKKTPVITNLNEDEKSKDNWYKEKKNQMNEIFRDLHPTQNFDLNTMQKDEIRDKLSKEKELKKEKRRKQYMDRIIEKGEVNEEDEDDYEDEEEEIEEEDIQFSFGKRKVRPMVLNEKKKEEKSRRDKYHRDKIKKHFGVGEDPKKRRKEFLRAQKKKKEKMLEDNKKKMKNHKKRLKNVKPRLKLNKKHIKKKDENKKEDELFVVSKNPIIEKKQKNRAKSEPHSHQIIKEEKKKKVKHNKKNDDNRKQLKDLMKKGRKKKKDGGDFYVEILVKGPKKELKKEPKKKEEEEEPSFFVRKVEDDKLFKAKKTLHPFIVKNVEASNEKEEDDNENVPLKDELPKLDSAMESFEEEQQKLSIRIELLRNTIEKYLGSELFIKVYRLIKKIIEEEGSEETQKLQNILDTLCSSNPKILFVLRKIDHLIYCEDSFYGSSKI